ncbi:MAG TPA: P1 family peptidase [Actinomycetota bacterium]|nr:P1 family peptidase [Actinomycetota bacterium]
MERRRAREHGVRIGRFPTGPRNAITDVRGVRVGHATVVRDPGVRTGVTAVFPTAGLPWEERVYVGTHVLNGYGEMIGAYQLNEWGILQTPIVLTSSMFIGRAYDAAARWIARHPGTEEGYMPVVSECDDSFLNDVWSWPLAEEDVWAALDAAATAPPGHEVEEGCVGAGTGMQCFEFKGGIGTASRLLPEEVGGYTVGALVLTNHGRRPDLRIDGVPVGREITDLMPEEPGAVEEPGPPEGSCVCVVATDAPLLPHQVRRLAVRAALGLARGGSNANDTSGELMVAFSTAQVLPRDTPDGTVAVRALLDGRHGPSVFSPLFAATVEAVEEAVVNALFTATTTVGRDGNTLHALPIDRTLELLDRAGRLER